MYRASKRDKRCGLLTKPAGPPTTSGDRPRRVRSRSLPALGIWLAWAVVVVALAYTKLWDFVAGGPSAWRGFAVFDGSFGGFGAAGEAASRGVRAIAGATGVFLAAQGAGALVARALGWRSESAGERIAVRTSLGFAVVSFLALGLSAVGLYTRPVLRVGVALAALAVVTSWWRTTAPRDRLPRLSLPAGRSARALAGVSLVAVGIALVGALAPEREWDALWYHLGFAPTWLDAGRLVDFPHEYPSLYPMSWELLFGTGMAAGGPVAAKLLHFAALPVTAGLVHATAHRHLPGVSPWVATALFVTIPTVLWEATTAYVDLALALHVAVGLVGAVRFAQERSPAWLAVAALSLGMAAATKHLALPAVAIIGVGLFAHLARRASIRLALAVPALLAVVAFAMASPWYVRSWQAAGNPVFPELHEVFGADPERWNDTAEAGLDRFKERFGRERTPLNLALVPWDMTLHAARYGGTLGPLFLALLPAMVAAAVTRPAARWAALFVAAFVAVWASPASSFQMRFLVPAAPVLAFWGAAGAALVARRAPPRLTGLLAAGLVALLVLNLPPFTPFHERDREGWDGWLTHVVHQIPLPVVVGAESEASYLARWVPSSRAWTHAKAELDRDARVLTFSGGDQLLSGEIDRIPADSVVAWEATWGAEAGDERGAVEHLRALEVTHVLFDLRKMADTPVAELALHPRGGLRPWFEPEYADERFVLVRLAWPFEDRAATPSG